MQPVWYTYYNISNQKTKCTKTIFLRKVSLNFSEIATEDNKDEDKASLPDTEVGEVEDFSQQQLAIIEADIEDEDEDDDESEPESKKTKYSAVVKKQTRPKVNSVLYI